MNFYEFAGSHEDLVLWSLTIICYTIYYIVKRITDVRTKHYEEFLEERRKRWKDKHSKYFDPKRIHKS